MIDIKLLEKSIGIRSEQLEELKKELERFKSINSSSDKLDEAIRNTHQLFVCSFDLPTEQEYINIGILAYEKYLNEINFRVGVDKSRQSNE